MRNGLRALGAVVAAAIAMLLTAHPANAIPVDNILVAHRGATTSTVAEGTMRSYQYAVAHEADILDGDVRWTKDGSDADHVGTMVIAHDTGLNRVTSYVRDPDGLVRTESRTGAAEPGRTENTTYGYDASGQ